MKNWIDFRLVKRSVSMEMLIVHYGFYRLRRKGAEVRLKCPFHEGKSLNSMAIDLIGNRFFCFGCKRSGNVLDFVAGLENCTIKEAALKLDEWFAIEKNANSSRL